MVGYDKLITLLQRPWSALTATRRSGAPRPRCVARMHTASDWSQTLSQLAAHLPGANQSAAALQLLVAPSTCENGD